MISFFFPAASAISIEEQRLLQSLERLNERLKSKNIKMAYFCSNYMYLC